MTDPQRLEICLVGVVPLHIFGADWYHLQELGDVLDIDPKFYPQFVRELERGDYQTFGTETWISETAARLLIWLGRSRAARMMRDETTDAAQITRPSIHPSA